ncbi:GNAT family N-acetyltransferase [Pseudoalteromonas gelatinilytica]
MSNDDDLAFDLRPVRHKDCQAIWDILKDPQVQSFNDYGTDITKGDVYDFIQGDIERFYNQQGIRLVIVLRSSGQVIGSVGLFNIIDGQGMLGFELASQYFGKGIMQKVLDMLFEKLTTFVTTPLNSVVALVNPNNSASIKLLTKCGFQQHDAHWVKYVC